VTDSAPYCPWEHLYNTVCFPSKKPLSNQNPPTPTGKFEPEGRVPQGNNSFMHQAKGVRVRMHFLLLCCVIDSSSHVVN